MQDIPTALAELIRGVDGHECDLAPMGYRCLGSLADFRLWSTLMLMRGHTVPFLEVLERVDDDFLDINDAFEVLVLAGPHTLIEVAANCADAAAFVALANRGAALCRGDSASLRSEDIGIVVSAMPSYVRETATATINAFLCFR
eukprot:c40255_g1_i1.p2 GENE.c40255_g1_i1~~c40255_g1_i1.p2  ORF type:complete len:144 (+),score=6.08 c40255_g1_i1:66-497(+)